MKRFVILAAASAFAVAAAAPASATVFLPGLGGVVTAPGSYTLDPAATQAHGTGTYADAFYFTLTNASAISASDLSSTAVGGLNLDFSQAAGSQSDLSGVQLRQLNSAQNSLQLLGTAMANLGGTQTGLTTSNSTLVANFMATGTPGASGTEGMRLGATTLSAGTYAILVNYTVTGAPAAYSGNLTLATAPVPEAATWGMMILGFGMMGVALRSRKAKIAFG